MGTLGRILALGVLLAFGFYLLADAQTTGGSTPSDFPQPIVVPYKNLDLYEKSTLNSRFGRYRDTSSTLGSREKRRSNVELNKPLEKKEEEAKEEGVEEGEELIPPAAELATTLNKPPAAPAGVSKSGTFYQWVDENGVVHITNNISLVPREERIRKGLFENPPKGGGSQSSSVE